MAEKTMAQKFEAVTGMLRRDFVGSRAEGALVAVGIEVKGLVTDGPAWELETVKMVFADNSHAVVRWFDGPGWVTQVVG
jgi:hypothetical protein